MGNYISKKSKHFFDKLIEEPYEYGVLLVLITLFFIPFIIWLCYFIGDNYFVIVKTSLKIGGALSFYGSILSFLGTAGLGVIALWQNQRFKRENDKSQKRLEGLAKESNSISEKFLKIEKNKFRPYIRLSSEKIYLAIGKKASRFSDEINEIKNSSNILFRGMIQNQIIEERKGEINYPPTVFLNFKLKNIGKSPISKFKLRKIQFCDGIIGTVEKCSSSMETSIFSNECKRVSINLQSKVKVDCEKRKSYNTISDEYNKIINKPISDVEIRLVFQYKDIYGRDYTQNFTMYADIKKESENSNEVNIGLNNIEIIHHADSFWGNK